MIVVTVPGSLLMFVPPAVLQRVSSASVTVDKQLVSSIGRGILVLAAIGPNDTRKEADSLAAKILKLKLWPDDTGANVGVPKGSQSRVNLSNE